jgi:hypothetical protein
MITKGMITQTTNIKNVDVPALSGAGTSNENAGELGAINAQALSGMGSSLKQLLANLPAGTQLDSRQVESLLVDAWSGLEGAEEGGMRPEKIFGRTEQLAWNPPLLTFTIERHGGTVNGSSRAELQEWAVNAFRGTAAIVGIRRRQLYSPAKRLDVRPLAAAIAEAILNNRESPSLKRFPDGRVKILIATVIPDVSYQQTVAGRRKRFRLELEKLIEPHGWFELSWNIYQRRVAKRRLQPQDEKL